jgi:hypothetical protein
MKGFLASRRLPIDTLLRRYAIEIDTSVNRQGCSLCSDLKNLPSGANESTAGTGQPAQKKQKLLSESHPAHHPESQQTQSREIM